MTSFYTNLSENIMLCEGYQEALSVLFDAYIKKTVNESHEIERDVIQKLVTTLQYFYQADDELVKKEGAEILSMLLYVAADKIPELIMIAENVYTEAGDFPNIELLQDKFQYGFYKTNVVDAVHKHFRKSLNTIEQISHPLTDYQRNLWEHLVSAEDVITSAPTSTGKTFIILKYLIDVIAKKSAGFAAIVVPTRALISEVATKVYDLAKEVHCEEEIEICTFPKEGSFQDKTIFIMTQERLFETLQSNLLTFDYLFVDEAHNISDKSRGVLLHMTLEKLLEDSSPQIIISMPSSKYLNAFDSVFKNTQFTTRKTNHSPVAKIFIEVAFRRQNIVLTKMNSRHTAIIEKGFIGTKFANIIYRLGKGESNIVYRNRTDYCENTANDISALIPDEKGNHRLDEAADYVAKFIHPKFTLADNLKKGVAFHYGPLPGVVRRMVEALARDKLIDFIVCTSTLAEGVNLPAKNLFLENPMRMPIYQESEKLEEVVLNNITGRAGRMLEHFAGNVFLVEPGKWKFKDYFETNDDIADRIPTYYQVLNEDLGQVIQLLKGNYDRSQEGVYTYYSIANKLLREFNSDTINTTLNATELQVSRREKEILLSAVQKAYENLEVDQFTLEANPTVGYLQQNNLYNFLLDQEDLDEWTLPHPMSPSLYDQLIKICSVLEYFDIFLPKRSGVEFVSAIAKKWIQGYPLRLIINEQIFRYPDKSCNQNVRNVILTINEDVRFKMATALRCYQLLLTNVAEQREVVIQSIKLHGFIEIGGCAPRLVKLVSLGLSRETAVEIHGIISNKIEVNSFSDLHLLYNKGALDAMHPITRKEIERLFL